MRLSEKERLEKMKMIEAWKRSGLRQNEYCSKNKIPYHVFHYWYGVFRQSVNLPEAKFLPINVEQPEQNMISVFGNNGIELKIVCNKQSVAFIKELLNS